MTRYLSILAMTTLVACGGDKDGEDTGAGDTDVVQCANSIASQIPAAESTDVYYKSDIRVTLAAEDPDATIVVTDASGAEISGSTTVDGTTLVWTGDDFAPSSTVTVTVNYECGETPYTLTTSDVGTPTTVDLIGKVYSLDLTTGVWLEPENVGAILGTFLEDTEIFVTPTAIAGGQITMLGGIGAGGVQDLCSPTIPFPAANWTDPYFELTAPQLTLDVAGVVVNIDDLDLSGAFASDGSRIQGTVLKGSIDTRPLVPLLAEGGADDAVCVLAGTLGVSCLECGDGSGPFCLSVWVDNIAAGEVAGGTLVPRVQADIDADPSCVEE
jgi:hypothetical protein